MPDDILKEAMDEFKAAEEAESENRKLSLEDVRFARLNEHWPDKVRKQRELEGRPCLTIPKLPAFIRQVVNDARQNKPAIKTHPVDDKADVKTAEIYNGLIRNIEYISDADVAYDTGVECAVDRGVGYWRVDIDYANDDTFDLDILIKRIANPFAVYRDPSSTSADSSDWNTAFFVDKMTKAAFKRSYPGAKKVDWKMDFAGVDSAWIDEDSVMVADWWRREEVQKTIVLLSDGSVMDADRLEKIRDLLEPTGLSVKSERQVRSFKVRRYKLTGAEVISEDKWPGKYIPIIPVYGDDFDIEGKRYLRSLIHNAKDAQTMFNYWRTTSTELVALAPRVPFLGPKGAFKTDAAKWQTINTVSHGYVEFDVVPNAPNGGMPMRQSLDSGVAAGALQEALNASDDMKAIVGLYDASLGARSNETSGKAIIARQKEGDVSTFHFIDNLTRAIRHTGRVIIDLIPHIYDSPRIVRVLGEDGSQTPTPINQEVPVKDEDGNPVMEPAIGPDGQPQMQPVTDEMGQPVMDQDTGQPQMKPVMKPKTEIYDLTAGKYDLVVSSGPSYTTRREEAATQMGNLIQAFPQAAPVVGPEMAKNLDWPGADEIAKKLEAMTSGQVPPQIQKQIDDGMKQMQNLKQENEQLKADKSDKIAEIQANEELEKLKIASNERIEKDKAASQERIAIATANFKAALAARQQAALGAQQPMMGA